ncbi:MAG: nucleoside-diphosphate sugar epimerase/dehydratase [Campylobacterales bacterium]|nr:nucleoside-diphosphate sugar epimerase/dehydratase [Campylobacterales bacterium]
MQWLRPSNTKRLTFFLLADILLSLFTLYSAYLLRFNFNIPENFLLPFWHVAFLIILLKIFNIALFDGYRFIWRFFALNDAKKLFFTHLLAYTLFSSLFLVFPEPFSPFPRSVIIIDLFLSFFLLGALRFSKRLMMESMGNIGKFKPAIIIGVSSNTDTLIKSLLKGDHYPVAIIAVLKKNQNMIGSTIHNIKIFDLLDLPELITKHNILTAIIEESLPQEALQHVYTQLKETSVQEIKRSVTLDNTMSRIESLSIEDLLARHPKDLDTQTIENFIRGKIIVITGAGGSIGSEIALQCHRFGALKLILIDHSEYNLYQIGEKLPSAQLRLCNILDKPMLDSILSSGQPDILIHAAAYKHVPLCEANIHAAITNNIIGSCNVIDSAIGHNVSKIVIISTDKAVRPTNIMGTTKRIVELYAQNVDPCNSEIVAVRFGNVLGSSGSVIPKFKEQIDAGGPITLTHPDITRYFMLISEACQLVLQAAAIARGGELFILDMGEPIKIIDLARTMIRLYAQNEIEILTTGLRPGEKLYEELLLDESEQKTAFESIMIAGSTLYPIQQLRTDIETLLHSNEPIKALRTIVPEFTNPSV